MKMNRKLSPNPKTSDLLLASFGISGIDYLPNLKLCIESRPLSKWVEDLEAIISQNDLEQSVWVKFLVTAASVCVESGKEDHLKALLKYWPSELESLNHEIIIKACKKNSFGLVLILYQAGFRVQSRFEERFLQSTNFSADWVERQTSTETDPFHELQILEASCKPAYLIARASTNQGSELIRFDPVAASFNLLYLCRELGRSLNAHSNKIKRIKRGLKDFQIRMLNLCDGSDQVEEFLNVNDKINGIGVLSEAVLPRLYEAMRLKNKKFVVHDWCQQKIREVFYDKRYCSTKEKVLLLRCGYILRQALLTPLYSVAYIANNFCTGNHEDSRIDSPWKKLWRISSRKVGEVQSFNFIWHKKVIHNLETPFNRMVSHTASYIVFILIIASNRASAAEDDDRLSWHDIVALIWAIGYLVLEGQLMLQLATTVDGQSIVKTMKCLLSDPVINFQFSTHFLIVFGMIVKSVGHAFQNLTSINFGLCSLGVGSTLCMMNVLMLMRLSPRIGPIHVAMHRCFQILVTFFVTFMIFTVAFAVGMNYVSRYKYGYKNLTHTSVYISNNHSVFASWSVSCMFNNSAVVDCDPVCFEKMIFETIGQTEKESPTEENDPHDHCKGYSIVWTRNEAESLANLGNVADEQSQFLTFRSSIKTLFWSLFDPGHPEVIGCTEGIPRYTAMLMWYAYNIIVVTVLLNLLIAVMNAAITSVQSNSVDAWKFARTQVWLEYCNKHVILPPPANLIALIKPSLILPCRRENNAQSTPSNPDESFGYSQLINQLVNKYKSDINMRKKL